MSKPIRVLVVDDSAYVRHTIGRLLNADPDIRVVGSARDGIEALEKASRTEIDVITLDVEMPRMDGLTTLRRLMREHRVPVIMVSGWTRWGAEATVRALALGAIDFVCKPSVPGSQRLESMAEELRSKVRWAAAAAAGGRGSEVGAREVRARGRGPAAEPRTPAPVRIVAIGSSTGGPRALHHLLPRFSRDFPVPIVVVQHMPAGFTRSLAEHLNGACALDVREAEAGDVVSAGQVLIAPGDHHLVVRLGGVVELNRGPAIHGVRPAVDVTLASLADTYGPSCLAVILTGMGSDGAEGALKVRKGGGYVIVEHESTCVVYGMPRSAVENGAADVAIPLPQIPMAIEQLVSLSRSRENCRRASVPRPSAAGRG